MSKSDKTTEPKKQENPETLAMAISKGGAFMPTTFDQSMLAAKVIAHSGMVPKQYERNTGAVLVAMQMGAELGLSPMASIQNIAVINGRPCIWGDAMLALVVSHPECEDVVEDDLSEIKKNKSATCIVKRRNRSPVKRTFSLEDAQQAGLAGGNVWQKYPYRMLQMRARGFALRDAFPDALRGIHLAEEARDMPSVVVVSQEPETQAKTSATKEALKAKRDEPKEEKAETGHAPKGKGCPTEPPITGSTGKVPEDPGFKEPEQQSFVEVGPPPLTEEERKEMEEAGF